MGAVLFPVALMQSSFSAGCSPGWRAGAGVTLGSAVLRPHCTVQGLSCLLSQFPSVWKKGLEREQTNNLPLVLPPEELLRKSKIIIFKAVFETRLLYMLWHYETSLLSME